MRKVIIVAALVGVLVSGQAGALGERYLQSNLREFSLPAEPDRNLERSPTFD